jgi:hypothetical protein
MHSFSRYYLQKNFPATIPGKGAFVKNSRGAKPNPATLHLLSGQPSERKFLENHAFVWIFLTGFIKARDFAISKDGKG